MWRRRKRAAEPFLLVTSSTALLAVAQLLSRPRRSVLHLGRATYCSCYCTTIPQYTLEHLLTPSPKPFTAPAGAPSSDPIPLHLLHRCRPKLARPLPTLLPTRPHVNSCSSTTFTSPLPTGQHTRPRSALSSSSPKSSSEQASGIPSLPKIYTKANPATSNKVANTTLLVARICSKSYPSRCDTSHEL